MIRFNRKFYLVPMLMLLIASCKTQKDSFVEPIKDLSGIWGIQKVVRNDADITQYVDTANFRLTLNEDNSYSLQGNNIPFMVNGSGGTWATDDPLYPFHLSFTDSSDPTAKSGDITTPVVNGERGFTINFFPGCQFNTYVYTFTKISE